MKLVAEILTGGLFYVEVEDNATVGDLKREIGKQQDLLVDHLILLLDGADEECYLMNENEASLTEYGIKVGSHIYIFFRITSTIDSPSTPKESISIELSRSMESKSGPAYNKDKEEANDDEPPHQEKHEDEANGSSASIDIEVIKRASLFI